MSTNCATASYSIAATTSNTLTANTWGFSKDNNTTWQGIPANTNPIAITSSGSYTATTGDSKNVSIGASIDYLLPIDSFTNNIVLTATTNAYTATPTITSISPNTGTTAGNTNITISGTNLDTAYEVFIDLNNNATQDTGEDCKDANITTPNNANTTITCTTQAYTTTGTFDVVIKTWGGATKTTSGSATPATTDNYTYLAPTVTISAPTNNQIFNAGTTSTTLTATTNIPATCYYGTTSTPTTAMATTGSTSHSQSITGLTNQSTHTYYIRCQAASGHSYGNTASTTFYVRAATPTLSSLSPANGAVLGYGTTSTSVSATSSAGSCTVTKESGTGSLSGSTLSGLANGYSTTLRYTCYAGSGNTQSAALTGTWSISVSNTPPPPVNGDLITSLFPAKCAAMTTFTGSNTSAVVAMLDNSDGINKYYAVAKLADGRCWMISNYARAYGTYVSTINDGTWTATTGLTTAYYADPGVATPIGDTRACTTNIYATSAAAAIDNLSDSGNTAAGSIDGCGYLYNWYGATAGTGTSSLTSTIVTGSICPSGWHLPSTGGAGTAPAGWANTTEFSTMYNAIGGTYANLIGSSSAWRGVYAGRVNPALYLRYQGTYGYYRSSTAYNNTNYAYVLAFYNTAAYPTNSDLKANGFAVRCVLNV